MARVLIAGCGDVGTALGRQLAGRGDTVFGLRRSAVDLGPGITPVQADLTRPETLAGLPGGLDQVVYAAAADGRTEAAYEAAYPGGLANLVAVLTARRESLQRLVFVSSTAVYAQDDGEWVDETAATSPGHFTGRNQLAAEAVARDAPWPAIAVRFGGIYGPGRRWLLARVERGEPCAPGLYTNRIHRDDGAGVLAHLLALEAPEPVYVAVDDAPAPQCEVMDWLAWRLGRPAPPRTHGGTAHGGAAAGGTASGKRCSNRRLEASGYQFIHPDYRAGYGAMLAHEEQTRRD
ncbi:MAG: NAD(P)H-binding protein [Gammaproteobacteria bacterium]|nr:NAD(P)H-binding protein [Gammaproteobacteria bacterium]